MTIVVRQARREDLDAIQVFIRKAYGPLAPFKDKRRWIWQFADNPFADSMDDLVPVWLAVDDSRVVGQIAVQRVPLYSMGIHYSAGWIVDVIVLPECRGLGLGHRLYSAVADSGLALITLTMAPATRKMAERLNAITLPPAYSWSTWCAPTARDIERYIKFRTQHRPNWSKAASLVSSLGLPRLMAAAFNARRTFGGSRLTKHALHSFDFERVSEFDASIDVVWKAQAEKWSGVPRTAQFLNWRFGQSPDLIYDKFLVKKSDRISGYVILRRTRPEELSEGIISDALVIDDDQETWESIYSFAKEFFGDSVASLQALTSSPAGAEALRSAGFIRRKRYDATIVCKNEKLLAELSKSSNWFFMLGDHDLDQVNLA